MESFYGLMQNLMGRVTAFRVRGAASRDTEDGGEDDGSFAIREQWITLTGALGGGGEAPSYLSGGGNWETGNLQQIHVKYLCYTLLVLFWKELRRSRSDEGAAPYPPSSVHT